MAQHSRLVVTDLHMSYQTAAGLVRAVRGVSFTVQPGEFYTLLGASGCGKTTILRCVAGLEAPEHGRIVIGDQVVYCSAERIAEPPHRRDIGMVFQSYAIWPHLTVFDNVAFPLVSGRRRFTHQQVREKTRHALRLVHLDDLADRPAPFLSGGQQQCIALARALVAEPAVLLLDEPLSNVVGNSPHPNMARLFAAWHATEGIHLIADSAGHYRALPGDNNSLTRLLAKWGKTVDDFTIFPDRAAWKLREEVTKAVAAILTGAQ